MAETNVIDTITGAIGKDSEGIVPVLTAIQQLFENATNDTQIQPKTLGISTDSKTSVKKLQEALGDLTNTYVSNVIDLKFPIANVNNKQQQMLENQTREQTQILFSAANTTVQKAIVEIQSNIVQLNNEREKVTSENKKILSELNALDKATASLLQSHELEVQNKLNQKEAVINELRVIKNTLESEITELRTNLEKVGINDKELFELEKAVLEKKSAELKSELKILSSLNVNATLEKNNLRTEIEKLNKKLEEYDFDFATFMSPAQNEKNNLKNKIKEKTEQITQMEAVVKQHIDETDKEIGELRAQLRIRLIELDQSKAQCAEEMNNLRNQLKQKEKEIRSLVDTKKDRILQRTQNLNKQTREEFLKELENERNAFKKYKEITNEVRKTLKHEIEDLQQSLALMLENKENDEAKKKSLEGVIQNVMSNNIKLKQEVASWEQFADMLQYVNINHIEEKKKLQDIVKKNKELINDAQNEKNINAAKIQNEIDERVKFLENDLKEIEEKYRTQFVEMEKLNIEHAQKLINIGEIITESDTYYFDVITEQQKEILKLQGEILESSKALETLKNELNEKDKNFSELDEFSTGEYRKLEEKILNREQFLNELMIAHEKNFNENNKIIALLNQNHKMDLNKIQTKNQEQKNQYFDVIQEQQVKIDKMQQVISDNQKMISEFENQLKELRKSNINLKKSNTVFKEQLENNRTELVSQTSKITNMENELALLKKYNKQLKDEKTNLSNANNKDERTKILNEIQVLKKRLEEAQIVRIDLELTIQKQTENNTALLAQNESILAEIKTAKEVTKEYIQKNTELETINKNLQIKNNQLMSINLRCKQAIEKREIIMNLLKEVIEILRNIILRREITPEDLQELRTIQTTYNNERINQIINEITNSFENSKTIQKSKKNGFMNTIISISVIGLTLLAFMYMNALQLSALKNTQNLFELPAAAQETALKIYAPSCPYYEEQTGSFQLLILQATLMIKEKGINAILLSKGMFASLTQIFKKTPKEGYVYNLEEDLKSIPLITKEDVINFEVLKKEQAEIHFLKQLSIRNATIKNISDLPVYTGQSIAELQENKSYIENATKIVNALVSKVNPTPPALANTEEMLDDVYNLMEKIKNAKTEEDFSKLLSQLKQNPNKAKIISLGEKLAKLYPPCT